MAVCTLLLGVLFVPAARSSLLPRINTMAQDIRFAMLSQAWWRLFRVDDECSLLGDPLFFISPDADGSRAPEAEAADGVQQRQRASARATWPVSIMVQVVGCEQRLNSSATWEHGVVRAAISPHAKHRLRHALIGHAATKMLNMDCARVRGSKLFTCTALLPPSTVAEVAADTYVGTFYHVDVLVSMWRQEDVGTQRQPLFMSKLVTLRLPVLGEHSPASRLMRVGAISDSQSGAPTFRQLLQHMSRPRLALDLVVHGGDAVQAADSDKEAYVYFGAPMGGYVASVGFAAPIVLLRGNHDNADLWRAYTRSRRMYHVLDTGAGRLLFLDSEDDGAAQEAWLARVCGVRVDAASAGGGDATGATPADVELTCTPTPGVLNASEAAPLTPRVAFVHVPPAVEYWERTSWEQGERWWTNRTRNRFMPLLRCCGVHMVISGHSHIYQRGHDILPAAQQTAQGGAYGPHIIINGGGGGTLEDLIHDFRGVDASRAEFHVTRAVHEYGVLEMSRPAAAPPAVQKLTWTARDSTATVIDTLTVHIPGEEAGRDTKSSGDRASVASRSQSVTGSVSGGATGDATGGNRGMDAPVRLRHSLAGAAAAALVK